MSANIRSRPDLPGRASRAAKKAHTTHHRRSFMKIRPLYDRILVKRLEPQEMKKGGIIIPDTAKEKPMEAEVVAVGKGKVNEEGKQFPLDVKKGDRILIGKYAGTEIKIDEEEHLILREDEVLAVVEK
jgi:chaperonin GroES